MLSNAKGGSASRQNSRWMAWWSEIQARHPHAGFALGSAVLLLLVFIVYIPVLNGGFIWDDDVTLTDNPLIRSPDQGLYHIWFTTLPHDYWPLHYSMLWLEWRLWGMNAAGYHVTNVLIHALGAIVLWRVLLRLRIPGAIAGAMLFAVHPVSVASAAWISERKNTLSLVFFLLSILWYLRSRESAGSAPAAETGKRLGPRGFYLLSLGGFILSLLSKTSVVVEPVVLLLCCWWLDQPPAGRTKSSVTGFAWLMREVRRLLPFFALSLVSAVVTVWFQRHRAIGTPNWETSPILERLVGGSWGIWHYLYKALFPLSTTVIYSRWEINTGNPLSFLPALAWVAMLFVLWRYRNSWSRGLWFALAYFTVSLAPVMGVFDMYYLVYSRVADHWSYLALLGAAGLMAGVIWGWKGKSEFGSTAFALKSGVTLILIVGFSILSWQKARVYSDPELLWTDNWKRNPKSWVAPNDLGVALVNKGNVDRGMELFKIAIAANPAEGLPYNNLGMALFNTGKAEESLAAYKKSLELKPNYHTAYFNLAVAQAKLQRWSEAVENYRTVIELRPDHAAAHNNLGNVLTRLGQTNEAAFHYAEAVRLRPDFAEAHYNLGDVMALQGKEKEALEHYYRAIQYRPAYANARCRLGEYALAHGHLYEASEHYAIALAEEPDSPKANLGLARALSAQGKFAEAVTNLDAVIKVQTNSTEAYYFLGNALMSQNKTNELMARFTKALGAQPKLAEAHYFVGIVLQQQGRTAEGVEHWQQALALRPDWVELLNNYAWLLASNPDARFRNGAEAVRLASHAAELTHNQDAVPLDTLAGGYAELGKFPEAVGAAQKAYDLAVKSGDKQLTADIQKRLELYKSGKPSRE